MGASTMRFTIKAKLGIAFGVILLLLGGAGYLAVSSLSSSNDRMQAFGIRPVLMGFAGMVPGDFGAKQPEASVI